MSIKNLSQQFITTVKNINCSALVKKLGIANFTNLIAASHSQKKMYATI